MRRLPFRRLAMYYLEHPGPCWICFLQTKEQRVQTQLSQKTLGPRQHHLSPGSAWKGRVSSSYSGALRDFVFGTFLPDNENAGGSAICINRDLLPEDALVTHVVTCQSRDHLVNIRSWRHNLVSVNVHFEPELTLRQLRGRLRLILPHWPAYPRGVGVILGDFNICDPEEGRLNVWNQTFTDGDPKKVAVFHSFFPHVLDVAQSEFTKKDATALGVIRTLSRIDRILINLPMAEVRDFHCSSHVVENLGKKTIPSDHAAARLVIPWNF